MNTKRKTLFQAEFSFWPAFVLIPIILAILYFGFLPVQTLTQIGSEGNSIDRYLWEMDASRMIVVFAIAVSVFCLSISAIVLFVSLPIFLLTTDTVREQKTADLVKTSLGFIVASGTGVIATLGFG